MTYIGIDRDFAIWFHSENLTQIPVKYWGDHQLPTESIVMEEG